MDFLLGVLVGLVLSLIATELSKIYRPIAAMPESLEFKTKEDAATYFADQSARSRSPEAIFDVEAALEKLKATKPTKGIFND